MFCITVNGKQVEAQAGTTVLQCARAAGVEVPALCHDPRLKPYGGCRLCLVEIDGDPRPVTSCNTPVRDGMTVRTHTPGIEALRKTLLQLLANHYPGERIEQASDKQFHRWLRTYGITVQPNGIKPESADGSHPYIQVNPDQCILCSRCVRICEEVQGQFVWKLWQRGDRTFVLPETGGTLAESACVSCGACVDTCPTGALEDKTLLKVHGPLQWTTTTCPYCGTGCELSVGTNEGRILTCKPVLDAPVNKGHLCSKGRYAHGFVHAPDRVLQPMIRKQRGWQTVAWEEAIAATETVIRSTVARFGPDSVGILASARATNEDNYLAQKFARFVLGTNNVDCCARVCHGPTAAAMKQTLGTGAATNSYDDIERARTILVCGSNATEAHPVIGARIKQAAVHGSSLIVVDPRRIELSEFADVHLRIRPGTNVAVLNAMACAIVEESVVDQTFVKERIADFDEFERFIRGSSPETMAAVCGVEGSEIRKAARIYASHKPSLSIHGLGMTEHVQGTDGVACLVNLALITGNIGKPGTGVNPLRGQNNVQGSAHMGCDPGALTGAISVDAGADLFDRVWGGEVPRRKGLNMMEMIGAARDSQLKLLWTIGYDIFASNAHTASTQAALKNLDALIIQDMFLNETAREFGTIFLPACSSFEKDGTFMNAERRIQRVRQVLPPLGDSKPDWEIMCLVAKAMGAQQSFSFRSPEAVWEEIRKVWPAGAGISYDRLESGGLQWPCPDEQHPGTTILHVETFPMGKRTSLPRIAYRPSSEAVSAKYPFTLITGRSLHQFNAGTMTGRTEHNRLRQTDFLDICAADAERLGICDGDLVQVFSQYGSAVLPAHISSTVVEGEVFATFHDSRRSLNRVTNPLTDTVTLAPQYKVTAVKLAKAGD